MKKIEDKITTNILDYFLNRPKMYQREHVLSKNSSCPRSNGIYAWYFKNVLLISHLDSLKDCVDMQIVIEKKQGYARVNQ